MIRFSSRQKYNKLEIRTSTHCCLINYIIRIHGLSRSFQRGFVVKGFFVSELGFEQDDVTVLSDSQSATHLVKNGGFHERTKHINTSD